jgi:hypothetical protein
MTARVREVLLKARDLQTAALYSTLFIAGLDGKPCSPRGKYDTLGVVGALMAATNDNPEFDMVLRWLRYHHFWPGLEPHTKDRALDWYERALTMTKGRTYVPERLAS